MTSVQTHPRIFELRQDFTGRSDESYDAVLALGKNERRPLILGVHENTAALPKELWFWADLERVRTLDFLFVNTAWKICSARMLATLRTLGNFPHVAIPVHLREARDDKDGILENAFFLPVLTQSTDALDCEKSELLLDPEDGSILNVKKWEFKALPLGYPPVFRIPERTSILLVTEATKVALEISEFKGISFLPQERIGKQ